MDQRIRIAVIDPDRCKPQKCDRNCQKGCPVNAKGKLCVTISDKISKIDEKLCIGCSYCIKVCPFEALKIVNLPSTVEGLTSHRFGENLFKLHRLPTPKPGQVLGLVGSNGTGKTTCLQILSQKIQPNLGNFSKPPSWQDIVKHYRGSEL
jgi:ATP-binding cassette subfamily E protein 1